MELNKQLKKELLSITAILTILLPVFMSISTWLKTETVIVLASTEKVDDKAEVVPDVQPEPTKASELIKDAYNITEIADEVFNEDAKLMLAIGMAESGLDPNRCHIDEKEYSCGWLQINLRAHFDKVPGTTYEEKAEYLKNPRNNALVGRFIKATQGKTAWTVYTNGAYKKFLETDTKYD